MTFLEAAEKVLKDTGLPMRPDEIARVAMARGLVTTTGKTPGATMSAQLATHVKDGGKTFVRTSRGFFGLSGGRAASVQPDLFAEAKRDSGYVYILTNPSFRRDWVKIGMTERPVNTRSKELDNTAVPLPFEIYATLKTNHRRKIEHLLHGSIDDIAPKKRIRKTREFFNISPETALKLLVRAAEVFDEEQCIDEVFRHKSVVQPEPKPPRPIANPVAETGWKNVTQLAKWITTQDGNIGAWGGVQQLLTARRPCKPTSKWRKPLEELGIRFDANNLVVDWRSAKM